MYSEYVEPKLVEGWKGSLKFCSQKLTNVDTSSSSVTARIRPFCPFRIQDQPGPSIAVLVFLVTVFLSVLQRTQPQSTPDTVHISLFSSTCRPAGRLYSATSCRPHSTDRTTCSLLGQRTTSLLVSPPSQLPYRLAVSIQFCTAELDSWLFNTAAGLRPSVASFILYDWTLLTAVYII
jgi:hypothetical protein